VVPPSAPQTRMLPLMHVMHTAGHYKSPPEGESVSWIEHLRVPALSVGTYSVPDGGADTQSPHTEDEVYVVTAGTAVLESGGERAEVGPGSVVYVPAHEAHRFTAITGDFAVLVFFAPAEYSQASTSR